MKHLFTYYVLCLTHWCMCAALINSTSTLGDVAIKLVTLEECGCVSAINRSSREVTARFTLVITENGNTKSNDSRCLEATNALMLLRAHLSQSESKANVTIASLCDSLLLNGYSFEGVGDNIAGLTIKNIDLSNSSGFLHSVRNLTRLQELGLVNASLTTIPNGLFEKLNNLQKLVIIGNHLTELPSQVFQGLTHLQELVLSNNKIEELPEGIFTELISLKKLSLDANNIKKLGENLFVENKNLSFLNLTKYISNPGTIIRVTHKLFRENLQLETLIMKRTVIRDMNSEIFAKLTNLKYLDLSSNSLLHLNDNWFRDLHSLETLILFANLDLKLAKNLTALKNLKNLNYLDIGMCGLKNLTNETFEGMINLETLKLYGNNFRDVPSEVHLFYNNSKLRIVSLGSCNISRFNPNWFLKLPLLESVDLSCNFLDTLNYADLFEYSARSLAKNVTFNLVGNDIRRFYFRSSEKLRHGNDSNSSGTVLVKINRLSILTRCDIDFMGDYMKKHRNIIIDESVPKQCGRKSKLLRMQYNLSLSCACEGSYAPCDCQYKVHDKAIDLNCHHRIIQPMFGFHWWPLLDSYQNYTINIDLSQNNLKNVPRSEWQFDNRITGLNLSNNQLNSHALRSDWSAKFPQLSTMDLSKNELSHIPSEFLTFVANSSARNLTLYLDGNSLRCDCSGHTWLKGLATVVNESNAIADLDTLECIHNGNRTFLTWALNNLTDPLQIEDNCPEHSKASNLTETASRVVIVPVILVLIAIGASIACWLAVHRFRKHQESQFKKNIQMESQAPLLKYDAFISYSHKDEEFVINELVPNLENPSDGSPKYRLCLHERDWLAGEWILDQINQSIATSHRTIIVLSENFIESFWGKHEFRVAYQQVIQSKQRRLIVVIKDEVPDLAPLDEDLRHFIANNTYLKWSDPSFWRRLREALPTNQVNVCLPT